MNSPHSRKFKPLLFVAVTAVALVDVASAAPGDTELVSVGAAGLPIGGRPYGIGADGRYALFSHVDAEIGHGYVRDRQMGITRRVTVNSGGVPANDLSHTFRMSHNGRFVLFTSLATNLATKPDPTVAEAVYLRDVQAGTTVLVEPSLPFDEGPRIVSYSISDDGRYLTFASMTTSTVAGVYVRDRVAGTTTLITSGMGHCPDAIVSANGRYVAIGCHVVGGPAVYVKDRTTATAELVSRPKWGTAANGASYVDDISADGRYVTFSSLASNLVSDDTNRVVDVFIRDRQLGVTERVSVSSNEGQGNSLSFLGDASDDGRFVAFITRATNLTPDDDPNREAILVRDRALGTTNFVSHSHEPDDVFVSGDGRYVEFGTEARLVSTDADGFFDAYVQELGLSTPPVELSKFTVAPRAGLAFGERPLGSVTVQKLWLRNRGTAPLRLLSIMVRGVERDHFDIEHACSTVPVGGGCSIDVLFRPYSVGEKFARVRILAEDGVVRFRDVSGTGVQ